MASKLPEQGLGEPGVQPERLIDLYRTLPTCHGLRAWAQLNCHTLAEACLHHGAQDHDTLKQNYHIHMCLVC